MPGPIKDRDDRNEPGPIAKLVMAASALFVAALFAYVLQQALTAPDAGEPRASLGSVSTGADGDLRVEVVVTNEAARGLDEVVVEVPCDDPPPEITFHDVPAQGERRGTVLCPAASDASPSVSSYIWT